MRNLRRQTVHAVALAWAAAWLLVASPLVAAAPPPPPELDEAALQIAAERLAVPQEELTVLASEDVLFPETGQEVFDYKIGHEPTDAFVQVTVDAAGAEQDLEALATAESDAHYARYGALVPELHDMLLAAPPDELVPVRLWIDEPFIGPPPVPRPDPQGDPTEGEIDTAVADNEVAQQQIVASAVDPVLNNLLAMGYFAEAEELVPVVFADLPADFLLTEVARWPEVLLVERDDDLFEPFLEVQVPACQSNPVHNQGITGSGVPVGVIEVGGQAFNLNPFLPRVTNGPTGCLSAHTTAVTGIIGSTHAQRLGHAYGSSQVVAGSCSGSSRELRRATRWARRQNARTFNLSWGAYNGGRLRGFDRFYDRLVRNGWRTVVAAAGNSGANGWVGSPATAYNLIAVGAYDDQNSTFWPDDVMAFYSSTRNPLSWMGDRTKPEVAAPGSNINSTTNSSPWTGPVGNGTSYAAPAVTGISALLMERSWSLRVWPEPVKAILMATAEHNIEGATRLSNRDGAGGVVADRADRVARRVSGVGNWAGLYYSCSNPNLQTLTQVSLTAGQRLRFVLVWDQAPGYRRYRRRPSADLDLRVLRPNGTQLTGSFSWDNTYEIVDFTAPSTGTYRFQARKYRCNYSPDYAGWAWHIVP